VPYSEEIEKRVDSRTARWKDLDKRRMFGGICYLAKGNMCFGIHRDYLIVRLGTEAAEARMKERHVRPFDITGRPMKGWVMVARGGWEREGELKGWLEAGRALALSLPPKRGGK